MLAVSCQEKPCQEPIPQQPLNPDSASISELISNGDDDIFFDVFLLIGQSNMAGRGPMIESDLDTIAGVWLLTPEAGIEKATNPLNKYSSVRRDLSVQKIGPGFGFSTTLYAKTGRPMLLVVNAKGGTVIGNWAEGTDLYSEAVRRAREAQRYGTIRGILWHQGESSAQYYKSYLAALSKIVSGLRNALGDETIPFVAGEIHPTHAYSTEFNEMIHGISEVIPNSGWVSTEGCGILSDSLHIDRAGQILLGSRYAEKIYDLSYNNQ